MKSYVFVNLTPASFNFSSSTQGQYPQWGAVQFVKQAAKFQGTSSLRWVILELDEEISWFWSTYRSCRKRTSINLVVWWIQSLKLGFEMPSLVHFCLSMVWHISGWGACLVFFATVSDIFPAFRQTCSAIHVSGVVVCDIFFTANLNNSQNC